MEYNVCSIDPGYNFTVSGFSYIGCPKEHTVMYISKKVGYLINNLKNMHCCLVFAEHGLEIDDEIKKGNCIIYSGNPQFSYAKFANDFAERKRKLDAERKYILTEKGYYIGENVHIGENAFIEPMCLIGHDVSIGNNAFIASGSIIKNAVIGDNFVCNENAVIGSSSFTMCEDEKGNKYRIPSMGRVVIGNYVEVGACDNIVVGGCGDTVIEDYVKIDALIHIAHDVCIHRNAELTAGAIVAGFVDIGERSFLGINSSIRNRIRTGEDAFIGMGAVVVKDVEPEKVVVGNPAREFEANIKKGQINKKADIPYACVGGGINLYYLWTRYGELHR